MIIASSVGLYCRQTPLEALVCCKCITERMNPLSAEDHLELYHSTQLVETVSMMEEEKGV